MKKSTGCQNKNCRRPNFFILGRISAGAKQIQVTLNIFGRLTALSLAAILLLTGCLGGNGSGISGAAARSPQGPAMELASGLYQRGESLRTLAVRGGVDYNIGQKRHFFKFEAMAIKPGYLLFTALDPAGRPAFRLASDGRELTGIFYGARQFVTGPATAANFGRFIPLGLTPDQLIALISGSQVKPASAGARETASGTELTIAPADRPENDNQLWRLKLTGPLDQNPATAVVQSAAFGSPRKPEISINYQSVKNVPREDLQSRTEPFPHSVEAAWTGNDKQNQSLRVTYNEVRLGLTLNESSFVLERPEGFTLLPLP